jgi:hypothetical protein
VEDRARGAPAKLQAGLAPEREKEVLAALKKKA